MALSYFFYHPFIQLVNIYTEPTILGVVSKEEKNKLHIRWFKNWYLDNYSIMWTK